MRSTWMTLPWLMLALAGTADAQAPGASVPSPGGRLLAWLAAVLVAAAVFLLWRRGRRPEPEFDPHYGVEAEPTPEPVARPVTRDQLLELPVASLFGVREVTGDTAVFQTLDADQTLDDTRKLVERNLIMVREPGAEPRSYEIGRDKAFAVGRLSGEGNTLSMPDPAMSSHHFRIVPADGRFYFLDLGSTNGSSVNGQRVDGVRELHSGDVIRAGMAEFEYQSNVKHLRS